MPKKWIPLESNPEVMTEFASRIGLDTKQYSFHDIFGLDEEVCTVHGSQPCLENHTDLLQRLQQLQPSVCACIACLWFVHEPEQNTFGVQHFAPPNTSSISMRMRRCPVSLRPGFMTFGSMVAAAGHGASASAGSAAAVPHHQGE